MEDARIFGETPFLAGKAKLTNDTDQDDMMNASISYLDEKSYSFSWGFSLTVGVKTNIRAKLPFIADGKVEVSSQISGSLLWNKSTKTSTSVGVTDAVPVPAKTVAIVEYVGTMGTCNIPFSYTQSSTDGKFSEIEQNDGIYEGVIYYNFDFHV
ncbi:hypothetical protein SASPL_120619 [Salvia splendens]|uniref:Uncharacterized protein n=1 Tax=Salvia splendens TaxID=180675 RepID=A0A8X8XUL7_SALSN|nr:hypothetical protein SASPL_120619 [Salvia splendens]